MTFITEVIFMHIKDPKMVLGAIDHFSINVKDIDDAFRFINEAGMNNTNDFIHFLLSLKTV